LTNNDSLVWVTFFLKISLGKFGYCIFFVIYVYVKIKFKTWRILYHMISEMQWYFGDTGNGTTCEFPAKFSAKGFRIIYVDNIRILNESSDFYPKIYNSTRINIFNRKSILI